MSASGEECFVEVPRLRWKTELFEDFSVMTAWEKQTSALGAALREWEAASDSTRWLALSRREVEQSEDESRGLRCAVVGDQRLWQLFSSSRSSWAEAVEAPAAGSPADLAAAWDGALPDFFDADVATKMRLLRALFGCRASCVILAEDDRDVARNKPPDKKNVTAAAAALYRLASASAEEDELGAKARAATLAASLSVAVNSEHLQRHHACLLAISRVGRAWRCRGVGFCRYEEDDDDDDDDDEQLDDDGGSCLFSTELFTERFRKQTDELRLQGVVDALAEKLGYASGFELAASAFAVARFQWRRPAPEVRYGRVCEWRRPVDDDDLALRLRGGIDGDFSSGPRRGKPLWGPNSEPIVEFCIRTTWLEPVCAADAVDDCGAPFSTLDPASDDCSWLARLLLRPHPSTRHISPERKNDRSCSDEEEEEDGDDDDDDREEDWRGSTPLAASLRSLAAAVEVARVAPASSSTADFSETGALPDTVPASLASAARDLGDRQNTLSDARLREFLEEIFAKDDDDHGPLLGDEDAAAAPSDRLALLALRIAGLSSFAAMSRLWRGFLIETRRRWEASDDMTLSADHDDHHDKKIAEGQLLAGRRALTPAVAMKVRDAARGCPLRRVVALVEASAAVAQSETVDASGRGCRQMDAPTHGHVAIELRRLAAVDDAVARQRARRAVLARLASDMAAFKYEKQKLVSNDDSSDDDDGDKSQEEDDEVGLEDYVSRQPEALVAALQEDDEDVRDAVAEVWDAVAPTPPHEAAPFFDPRQEAEHALHRLDVAHPSWIMAQLWACAATTAVFVLREAAASLHDADGLASVRGALDSADRAVQAAARAALAGLGDHDTAAKVDGARDLAVAAVDAVAAAETHLSRAVAVLGRLQQLGDDDHVHRIDLADALLRAANEPIAIDVDTRPAVLRLFHSLGPRDPEDPALLPSPDTREFVLWAETRPDPRDAATLPNRVYAHCKRRDTGFETTFAFALSRQDHYHHGTSS